LKLISNGYYHYRVYSKTKNIKFIICFEKSHLTGTLEHFITNIKNFSESFKDYPSQQEKIWQSCAFIVTKCSNAMTEQASVENIIEILR